MKHETIKSEYNAGYDKALVCWNPDHKKIALGIKNSNVLIRVYWQGYKDALSGYSRNTINFGTNPNKV